MKRDVISCLGKPNEPRCKHLKDIKTGAGSGRLLYCMKRNRFIKDGKKPCEDREVTNGKVL